MAPGRRGFGQITRLPSKRYRARYTGPDTALHNAPTTFLRKEDAEAWLADERRLISHGDWTPPGRRKAEMIAAAMREAAPELTVGQYVERIIARRSSRARKPIARTTSDTYRKDSLLRPPEVRPGRGRRGRAHRPQPLPRPRRRQARTFNASPPVDLILSRRGASSLERRVRPGVRRCGWLAAELPRQLGAEPGPTSHSSSGRQVASPLA